MVKSLPPRRMGLRGGMAERLKAHVLKTCLGHTNVGSNPTPSAIQSVVTTFLAPFVRTVQSSNQKRLKSRLHTIWGGARVVEWGRLLSGYRGEILGRRFESCPPRHTEHVRKGVFLFGRTPPLRGWYSNSVLPATLRSAFLPRRRSAFPFGRTPPLRRWYS